MTFLKAVVRQLRPCFYSYEIYWGNEKRIEDFDYPNVEDSLRAIANEIDDRHAIEFLYNSIVIGTYTGLELR